MLGMYLALGLAILLGVFAVIALFVKLWKWKSQHKSATTTDER